MSFEDIHNIAEKVVNSSLQGESVNDNTDLFGIFKSEDDFKNFTSRFENAKVLDATFLHNREEEKHESHKRLMAKLEKQTKRAQLKRKALLAVSTCAAAIVVISFWVIGNSEPVAVVQEPIIEQLSEVALPYEPSTEVRIIAESGEVVVPSVSNELIVKGTKVADMRSTSIDYSDIAETVEVPITQTLIEVPEQKRFKVILADGTTVHLYENSTLSYPSRFTGDTREVKLTGSGYFEVTKSDKKFIVNHSDLDITVYGTEFSVMADELHNVTTTLVEGSVGVHYAGEEYRIKPNERIITSNQIALIESNIDTRKVVAWRNGYFRSDEESLYILLAEVAEWYNVDIQYSKNTLKGKQVSAYLDSTMPLSELLEMLAISAKIEIEQVDKNKYIVK